MSEKKHAVTKSYILHFFAQFFLLLFYCSLPFVLTVKTVTHCVHMKGLCFNKCYFLFGKKSDISPSNVDSGLKNIL